MRWLACICATLGLILALTACSKPPVVTDGLTLGALFPEVDLITLEGEAVPWHHYQGKLVVLNIWATWCEPCRREMPNLQSLSDSLDSERFAVIGLAVEDDPHVVREFLIDKGVSFTSYLDAGQKIATQTLGIALFPYTLLIAQDGTVIQRVPGPREWQLPEVKALLERAYEGDYSGL